MPNGLVRDAISAVQLHGSMVVAHNKMAVAVVVCGLVHTTTHYTHHIGDVAGSAMRTAMCTCQYSLLMVELADSNSRNGQRMVQ